MGPSVVYEPIEVEGMIYMGAFHAGYYKTQNLYLPFYREGHYVIPRCAPPYAGTVHLDSISGNMLMYNGTQWIQIT